MTDRAQERMISLAKIYFYRILAKTMELADIIVNEDKMTVKMLEARLNSWIYRCTTYVASNGEAVIWGTKTQDVAVDGYWICCVFDRGKEC